MTGAARGTAPSSSPAAAPLALVIVPARLESSRMPKKMLRRDTGAFLFEHTVRNAQRARLVSRVVLATDSEAIMRAAEEVGVEAMLTSQDHASGTDRIDEALAKLTEAGQGPFDVVLNVQGDEPELDPADLDTLIEAFGDDGVEMATLYGTIHDQAQLEDPHVVKVVCDRNGDALYFSRSPIPSRVHPDRPPRAGALEAVACRSHIGVYAFRPEALRRFCSMTPGDLEVTESLEQLRWLENGGRMRVLPARTTTRGIDTEEDYAAFKARVMEINEKDGATRRA